MTVTVTFRLYIKVTNDLPSSGNYIGTDSFTVFQLDGSGGINVTAGAKNLKYTLSGLSIVRFIPCGADLVISPASQVVNLVHLIKPGYCLVIIISVGLFLLLR